MPLHFAPPSEQTYECCVPLKYYGFALSRYFADRFDYLDEPAWTEKINSGHITVNGQPVEPGYILQPHDRIRTRMGMRSEPPVDRTLHVLYEDARHRVFNKPAPLPVHPCGRYYHNSMTEALKEVYPDEIPRPVQRLDSTTTGVQVFARTREAAVRLMEEFKASRVQKTYIALVDGEPQTDRFVIDAPIGKVKGSARGVGSHTENPKPAITEVETLVVHNGRALVRAIPRTGRTNQIRVHLAHVGLPVYNDPVYGHSETGSFQYGLHAHRLEFTLDGETFAHVAPVPPHFGALTGSVSP